MSYLQQIKNYRPRNEQEAADQQAILAYHSQCGDQLLVRENLIAHITSSAWIVNPARTMALLVHHNIRNQWSWTGGHADGDSNLLHVAMKEAREETGVAHVTPLSEDIASLDVVVMESHHRRGLYVGTHLHLSVAYLLECDERETLCVQPEENSAVRWFSFGEITTPLFSSADVSLYQKLTRRALRHPSAR